QPNACELRRCCPNREASSDRRSRFSTLASAFFALLVDPEPPRHQWLSALQAWQSHLLAPVGPGVPRGAAPWRQSLPELLKRNGQRWPKILIGCLHYAEKTIIGRESSKRRRQTTF